MNKVKAIFIIFDKMEELFPVAVFKKVDNKISNQNVDEK